MAGATPLHLQGSEFRSLLRESEPFNGPCQGSFLQLKVSRMCWLTHRCPIFLAGCVPGCLSATVLHCLSVTTVNITLFPADRWETVHGELLALKG